jgi:proline-specific peptidase
MTEEPNCTANEGLIDFNYRGYTLHTFYKSVGDINSAKTPPLVVLHGGPSLTHHYTLPNLSLLSHYDIPVILYDQCGNGKSSRLSDKPKSFITIELFMDELKNLLEKLNIVDNFYLLGHSWGGMLAANFAAIRRPAGLKKLIIASAPVSLKLGINSTGFMADKLPDGLGEVMKRCEREGDTDNAEYKRAQELFWKTFTCQVAPMPEQMKLSMNAFAKDNTVHKAL